MKTIHLDIETFSSVDLKKCGLYRYTESPDFEILLFGYAVDGGTVQAIDLACGETIPADILEALTDDTVTKLAHNSAFERICLSRYLRDLGVSLDPFADNHHSAAVLGKAKYLNPESWRCTMVWAAYMGLPLALEGVGAVLGLEKQKLTEGKDLIRYFCKPCVPTIKNGGRTRNLPEHDPEKWAAFKEYNIRDVEVEMAIEEKLKKFPVPDEEWDNFILDQQINDRGILLDMTLVHRAIEADALSRRQLSEKIGELTSIENSNSVAQMKTWLADNGLEMDSLGKKEIAEALQTAPPALAEVLRLRQSLAKSSVKKYQAMQNCVCADQRARGLIQFYGANRTGRFSGRLIQVQNLPQNHLEDLEQARNLVKLGDFDAVGLLYNSTQNVLSELIRTAFVPKPGGKFIVADFSAIEARVIAWLAGETWRNEVFSTHGKIYEASAAQMLKVPIDSITKTSPLRQKGKIAELALGYGGSVGALKAMGALEMGLDEGELQPLVNAWRAANPNIVKLWWDVDRAIKKTVTERIPTEVRGVKFARESGFLFITLPSGRKLAYVKPRIGENRFGGDCVTYEGVGGTKKWERIESYGPKFVENIVQAIARDILCYALRTFRCCEIVMHCCYRAKKTREDFAQKTRAGRSRGPGREASAKSIQKRGQNGLSFARRVTLPFSRFIWESILPHYLRSCTCFLLCAFLFFALSFHGFYSRFARVVTTTTGTNNAITADEVMNLIYALKRPYRKNASFLTNDQTLSIIRKLKDANGAYLWQPSYQAGEPDRLLGYSVHTSPFMPVPAAGAKVIAFGDYSYYNIGDRGTRSFAELKELFAGNGMVAFLAKERVDGKLLLPEAVQVLKIKAGSGS